MQISFSLTGGNVIIKEVIYNTGGNVLYSWFLLLTAANRDGGSPEKDSTLVGSKNNFLVAMG